MVSLMNLPSINHVLVGGIISFNIGLLLDARSEKAILYTTDSIFKGHQFFKYPLALFPLSKRNRYSYPFFTKHARMFLLQAATNNVDFYHVFQ